MNIKRIITTALTLFITVFAFAQEAEFDTLTHDFGDVQEGPTYKTYFVVTNTGDKPLKFINASASCGCTVADYPKQAIKPGESDTIEVTYNSKNRYGKFTKKVTVWDSKGKEYHLTIKGYVIPERALLEWDSNHIDLGSIPAGEVKTYTLQFENRGGGDLEIAGATADCGNVTAKVSKVKVPFGEKAELQIKVDTRGREGVFDCTISVKSNSYVFQTVYMRANVVKGGAKLFISKDVYDVGVVSQGEVKTVKIPFKNTGGQTLKLIGVQSPCNYITAELSTTELAPGEEGEIIVTIKTTRRNKSIDCDLTVVSEGQEPRVVKVRGIIAPDK